MLIWDNLVKGEGLLRYISAILFVFILSAVSVAQEKVTPYGDYCEWCSSYGICEKDLGQKEAETAIKRYFRIKGLNVRHIIVKGRFMEADIYDDIKEVDKIIFDRKTGRIRSTY